MKRDIRKLALAQEMRKALTTPEFLLWERLKTRDDSGLVFRRQHPKGPFILDFYCHAARLCIEIDGAAHGDDKREARDLQRDGWLASKKIMTCRIPAAEVFRNPDEVADGVWLLAESRLKRK